MKKIFLFAILLFLLPISISSRKNKIIYLHEQKARSIEQTALNTFIKEGNVIIVFYEDWCGPCKRMTPILQGLAESIDDILFIKIKRSLYRAFFDSLGLTTIPAMVFFKKGKIVHVRRSSATKEEMKELIQRVFYGTSSTKNAN
jgi:thioredoxin 1